MLDAVRGQEGWTTGLMLLSIVACAIAAMLGKTRLVFGDVTLLITEDSVQCWPSKGFIGLHLLPCLTVHGEVSRSLGSSPPSLMTRECARFVDTVLLSTLPCFLTLPTDSRSRPGVRKIRCG
ncbi:hypothetical protein B0T11DRAFT_14444 [Plectosphaerella cucumerina]|uniref:Uncharacterized protein n=1 Tax=Plectosphaerella cucumerina TaxID=40658 RepID=A0A8K0TTV1_9PEZI|nr:hypothetical protein B0T11DRAFT_14444 [Plectosphaerella cucumerina]